ncbi:MAG: hypothetical protein E6G96_19960 [Alphaproteobacteria bacterium]|nr:MAG: hypothetical protein E6G96_19960 [Alphaproteobacteria bacterium]
MATAVQTWNDDTAHIGLIVAVGGVGAATVALNNATTPWIALIGGAPASFPSSPLSFFKGAVSLESYTYNAQRRAHLTAPHARGGKGIPLQNICLLYNPNSACSATEAHDWPAQSPKVSAGINQHGLNDPITLWNAATQTGAFDTIPANVQAVVVSADPFFQDNKNPLVTAANNWVGQAGTNRLVCYPMPEYKTAQPNPTPRKRIFHGPSLEKAYTELGRRAASFMRNGTAFNLSKQQLDNPDED